MRHFSVSYFQSLWQSLVKNGHLLASCKVGKLWTTGDNGQHSEEDSTPGTIHISLQSYRKGKFFESQGSNSGTFPYVETGFLSSVLPFISRLSVFFKKSAYYRPDNQNMRVLKTYKLRGQWHTIKIYKK